MSTATEVIIKMRAGEERLKAMEEHFAQRLEFIMTLTLLGRPGRNEAYAVNHENGRIIIGEVLPPISTIEERRRWKRAAHAINYGATLADVYRMLREE